MRRTGRSALAQGATALAVMAAGIVVVATDGSTPVANADTVLGVVNDARIVSPSGATRLAVAGDRLVNGDVITTGAHGSAQLITRHRTTLLGGLGALAIVNGGRQELRHGTAVVDALHGPQLDLVLSRSVVTVPRGSATEAARGPSTRVGALSGPAAITSMNGRRLMLTPLSQAVLSGDAVPGSTTPLHLTDSPHEFSVVPGLVKDDIALKTLARGIDTTGRSTARVVEASWTGVTQPVPDRVNRSERVLPVLIADSTHGFGSAQQRYNSAVAWRAEGGSWGVVLHLLSGNASAVETTLAALQRSDQSPGQIGTVAGTVSATGSGPRPFKTPPVHPHGSHAPTGESSPKPSNPPPPPPPDTLLGGLVATVQNVIDGVLGLLPHDKSTKEPVYRPKPSSGTTSSSSTKRSTTTSTVKSSATSTKSTTNTATTKTTPTPSQSPSNGLLGNLLGGLLGHR